MKKSKSKKGRSAESLEKVSKSRGRREKSLSVDREGRVKDKNKKKLASSRDSSVSSIGREVRCACQYYMSDSLLPERTSLFGSRSPSRTSNLNMAQSIGDHEYEPINPPPPSMLAKSDKQLEGNLNKSISESSIPENERRLLRIPLDSELVVTSEGDEENAQDNNDDIEVERMTAQDLQDDVESRYLSATPTTTETQSRTDCDVNTSMLDSSGLEDLPLNRGSRDRKSLQTKTEQMRAHAQGLQSKIKTQAGKLRSKLRSIPRPNFNIKERPRLSLPERPKFKLPERPKLNLPERPKFNLPERPKFNLPERPKFNLPERPKFNFPERPKFNFPNKPKINLPSFGKSRPLRERQVTSVSSAGSRKNLFDFEFKNYPKMFNKKTKNRNDYATSSPKQTRGCTPPPRMASGDPIIPERKKGPVGQKWVDRFDDIKYADENGDAEYKDKESRTSNRSESISDFRDNKDFGYTEELEEARLPPGRRTVSTKSSMSHLSEREIQSSNSSEDRHRRGVIEEIDSDEFFLRQKGISQDDVNMEKYLSEEIREAFKSPVVNALAQMDYDYEIDEKANEPMKPDRTRSLRRTSKQKQQDESSLDEDRFKTYPPNRPIRRKSRSKSRTHVSEDSYENEQHRYANQPVEKSHVENNSVGPRYSNEDTQPPRYENLDDVNEYYKTPTSHYQVPNPNAPAVLPTPTKRRHSSKGKKKDGGWVEVEIETSVEEVEDIPPPQATKRRKSKKEIEEIPKSPEDVVLQVEEIKAVEASQVTAEQTSLKENEVTTTPVEPAQVATTKEEPDYIIPKTKEEIEAQQDEDIQPVPPKRSRSRGSRSLHSLVLDDRSRKSEPRDIQPEVQDVQEVQVEIHRSEEPPSIPDNDLSRDDLSSVGYATVGKPVTDKPEPNKRTKPPRPPPPRKKRSTSPQFNTLPSRFPKTHVPLRPIRYSTLGPSRPPRHRIPTSSSNEHIYVGDTQSQAYFEIQETLKPADREDIHGSNKDLQKEEVIEKMKVRPLPPPPRPPRHKRDDQGDDSLADLSEDARVSLALLRGEASYDDGVEIVEEVSIAIQTDPVSEDFEIDMDDDSMIQELSHEERTTQEAFVNQLRQEENDLLKKAEELAAKTAEELQKQEAYKLAQAEEERKRLQEATKQAEEERLKQDEERKKQEEERKKQEHEFEVEIKKKEHELELERKRQEYELEVQRKQQEQKIEEEKKILQLEKERQEKEKLEEQNRLEEEKLRLENEKRQLEEQRRLQEEQWLLKQQREEQEAKLAEQQRLELQQEAQRLLELAQRHREDEIKKAEQQLELIIREENRRGSSVSELQRPETDKVVTAERQEELKAERPSRRSDDKKKKNLHEPGLSVDDDMGYASLDRRVHKEPDKEVQSNIEIVNPPQLPVFIPIQPDLNTAVEVLRTERLKIDELDVGRLKVSELQASNIITENLRGNNLNLGNISSESGNLTLRNIELPPNFIEQIIARIPWEELRPTTNMSLPQAPTPVITPIEAITPEIQSRVSRRHRIGESEEDGTHSTRRHRRHHRQHRYSTDDEEEGATLVPVPRRHARPSDSNIFELSRQLARACTSAGIRAMRQFAGYITTHGAVTEERKRGLQLALCILLILVAGFILMGMNRNGEHHHHWDFQFPPQAPPP